MLGKGFKFKAQISSYVTRNTTSIFAWFYEYFTSFKAISSLLHLLINNINFIYMFKLFRLGAVVFSLFVLAGQVL